MSGERYHSVTTSLVYLPMRTARNIRLLHRNARRPRKTEIAQLQLAISVDEKVLRLEVPRRWEKEAELPVENAIAMAFLQSTEDLIHEGLGVRPNGR